MMHNANGRSSHHAFTLIELLVAISIIALLIGILLPVLSSARERGRQIACAANVSQIGKALDMYANQFRDLYPIAGGGIPWGTPWNSVTGTHPGWMEQFSDFFGDPKGFKCPSYPNIVPSDYNYFLSTRAAWIATGAAASVDRRQIKFSSAMVLAGDNTWDLFGPTSCDHDDYTQDCLYFAPGSNHWEPQHSGTLNVLFADTHVANLKEFDPLKMTFRYDTMSAW